MGGGAGEAQAKEGPGQNGNGQQHERIPSCDPVFSYVHPLFRKLRAQKDHMELGDLPELDARLLPEVSARRLEQLWTEERERARAAGRKPSLQWTMARLLGGKFSVSVLLMWVAIVCNLLIAVLTNGVVQAVEGKVSPEVGYGLAACFFGAVVIGGIFTQHAQNNQTKVSMIASGSLNAVVFRKLALITSKERSKYTEGQIINFSAVDCQTVLEVSLFLGFFVLVPVQIIVCTILLYLTLGPAFLLGLAILCVNMVAVDRVGDSVKKLQAAKNILADQRNIVLNEALQGIRTIKLLAWERAFLDRVEEKRGSEMENLNTTGFRRALQAFLSFGLPTLATVATFVLFTELGNDLEPAGVFMSLALFEYLNMALVILPNFLNEWRRLLTSVERIETFLSEDENYVVGEESAEDVGLVEIKNGSFFWSDAAADGKDEKGEKEPEAAPARAKGQEKGSKAYGVLSATDNGDVELAAVPGALRGPALTLTDINVRAEPGQLLAVVGKVSSGKTTLANALLGLIGKASGSTFVGGRTAFVAQQPFIMNDSVRENIIFRGDFEEAWYKECIKACCLEHDMESFVAGDATQVGERGITISGGQKQRVALARAAYFRPDVVILDDPLSAMDAHVGREIFDNLILGLWRRQGTTVILITNQLWVCDRCDSIVLLDEGRVREQGTYAALTDAGAPGRFRELMSNVTGNADAQLEVEAEVAQEETKEGPQDKQQEKPAVEADSEAKDEATEDAAALDDVDLDEGDKEKEKEKEKHEDDEKKGKIMSTEERAKGRVGWDTVMDLVRAADAPGLGMVVLLVSIASPVVQWLVGWALAEWTQTYVDDGDDVPEPHENVWLYVYVGLAIAFSVLAAARAGFYNWFFIIASTVLHNKMLGSIFKAPMALFDTTPVGRILNRFQMDMTILDVALPRLFDLWSFLVGVCATAVILAGVLVPPMLPAALALVVFGMYMYAVVGSVVLELRKLSMIMASPMISAFGGFINGLDSIRAFGRTEAFASRFEENVGGFLSVFFWMRTVEHWINASVVGPAVGLFLGGLAVVLVAMRDYSFINPSLAGLALSYASLLGLRIPGIMFISTALEQLLTSVQRLVEYIDLEAEPDVETKAVPALPQAQVDAWPASGAVRADGLKLRYREELPLVLKGVNFSIASGERVGVVGRTGAGKSTLNLAAFRMAPIAGGSLVIGGEDVRAVPLNVLRDRVGMIPQDAWLYSGTVRANLDPFGEFSDAEIFEVLDLVSIGKYVRDLGADAAAKAKEKDAAHQAQGTGLDFVVNEKGDNFSSGMVQLFCMARVLLRKPKVVFMDEATASVDLETDVAVQRAIRGDGGLRGATLITVAHRLQTVIDFDKILVMADGRAVEFGHPHELLQNPGSEFTNLVENTGAGSAAELRNRAEEAYRSRKGSMAAAAKG